MRAKSPGYSETPSGTPISPDTLPPEQTQAETNARVAGATAILAIGNILSRVMGLARETTLSFLFGASAATDAFNVAVNVPKAFYDLLIGGHVNGAIVPVLSEIVTVQGRDELWRVVSILCSLMVTVVTGLVVLIELFAPQIVMLAVSGYDAVTLNQAAALLRVTGPALLFLGLFAILSGTLYALKRFTWPALAGGVFNSSIVLVMLLLTPPLQFLPNPTFDPTAPVIIGRPLSAITSAALGWLVGAILQFLFQWPGLRDARLRFTFNWRHPALRSIALLYAPVMFSLIMDTLVIRFFSYNLASQTGIEGGITYMTWSTTLIQFPQGLVATAISIAILPTLAGQAALIARTGWQAFRDTLGLGLRLAITLIIPATVGLFVMAVPIVALIFEHGEFVASDTAVTALALRLYLIGLPFAAVDLLLVYAFYARKNTLTPALIGLVSHLIYIVTVLLLFERLSLFSLMIADSVKHIVHAGISAIVLRRLIGGYGDQRLLLTTLKTLIAAGLMGLVGWWILPPLSAFIGTHGILREALLVLVAGGICAGTYLGLAALLRVDELAWALRLLGGKLRGRKG